MKKLILMCVVLMLGVAGLAVAVEQMADIAKHPSCAYCGMDRQKFAKSRMEIDYEGDSVGLCSLHCAALELANQMDKRPEAILVADYGTGKLIDAEKATWVLGGKVKGVMTGRAKWAFADREAAKKFIAAEGGEPVDFEAAVNAAYQDMYQDTRMIRMRRQEMKKMKGKM